MFRQANWGNPLNIFSVSDLRGHCLIAREFIDNSGALFGATWVILREDATGGGKERRCSSGSQGHLSHPAGRLM